MILVILITHWTVATNKLLDRFEEPVPGRRIESRPEEARQIRLNSCTVRDLLVTETAPRRLWSLGPEALSKCNTVPLHLGKNWVTFEGWLLDRTDPCRPGAPISNTACDCARALGVHKQRELASTPSQFGRAWHVRRWSFYRAWRAISHLRRRRCLRSVSVVWPGSARCVAGLCPWSLLDGSLIDPK
jgi:hypothetical protein